MSISVIRKGSRWRISLVWLLVAAGCIAVSNIYALFGHGVRSSAMDWMFLYPLLAGCLPCLLLALPRAGPYARLARNLYDSGIATLTAGGMLRGILEIAGTASPYPLLFSIVGWMLLVAGAALWIPIILHKGEKSHGH